MSLLGHQKLDIFGKLKKILVDLSHLEAALSASFLLRQ